MILGTYSTTITNKFFSLHPSRVSLLQLMIITSCPWGTGNVLGLLDLVYWTKWVFRQLPYKPQRMHFSVPTRTEQYFNASTENQYAGTGESSLSQRLCCPYCTVFTGSSRLFPDLVNQFCSAALISVLPLHSVVWRKLVVSRRNVLSQSTHTLLPQRKTTMGQYFVLIQGFSGGHFPKVLQMN